MTKRPIVTSPHLQIYKPQLTSMLSISHRISGMILFLGFVLLALSMSFAILHPVAYDALASSLLSWIIYFAIFAVSAAWIFHFLAGIRHLAWDKLIGLELRHAYCSGYAVIAIWAITLIAVWVIL